MRVFLAAAVLIVSTASALPAQGAGPRAASAIEVLSPAGRRVVPPLVASDTVSITPAHDAKWNAAFIGAIVGGLAAGGLAQLSAGKHDAIGPPPWLIAAPAGALVGFLGGLYVYAAVNGGRSQ